MTAPTLLGPEFADEVEALLTRLGNTPKAVGEYLIQAGVKGVLGSPEECVVASLLRSLGFPVDEVDPALAAVIFAEVHDGDRWHLPTPAALPTSVRQFAIQFDRGRWPQLVRAEVAS